MLRARAQMVWALKIMLFFGKKDTQNDKCCSDFLMKETSENALEIEFFVSNKLIFFSRNKRKIEHRSTFIER